MRRSLAETVMALIVLATATIFLWHTLWATAADAGDGIAITAEFFDVGPLEPNAPVMIGSGRVGTVTDLRLDPATYLVNAEIRLIEGVRLPVDSRLSVGAVSLFGGAALVVDIGSKLEFVADGGRLRNTKNARSLEDEFAIETLGGLESGGRP